MSTGGFPPGPERAARLLRELLLTRRDYRRQWERATKRGSTDQLRLAGVQRVLAQYLQDSGERSIDDEHLERELKDRVRRAIGEGVSHRQRVLRADTLHLFVAAFGMSDADAEMLFDAWSDAEDPRFGSSQALTEHPEGVAFQERQHETILLQEFHTVGPDRLPFRHRTIQGIRATADGLASYPYVFDTTAAMVQVERGGKAGPIYAIGEGLFVIDVQLPRPLEQGETASLEYYTWFRYSEAPEPCFRRQVRRRASNVELAVEFSRLNPPRRVWWSMWDGLEGPLIEDEPVGMANDLTVHRYLASVEEAVVGWRWEW